MKQFVARYAVTDPKTGEIGPIASYIDEVYNGETGRFEYTIAEVAANCGSRLRYSSRFLLDTAHSRLIYNHFPNLVKL